MTPRERVMAALNHEEPDRIPIDMGNTISSIHADAYRDLVDFLGFNEPEIWSMDLVSRPSKPSERVLRKFHVDTRYVYPSLAKIEPNPPRELVDIWGIRRRFTGRYYDLAEGGSPLANINDVEQVRAYRWPKAEGFGFNIDDMVEQAERLSRQDYAIGFPYVFVGSFAHSMQLRGYQKFLSDLILRPKIAESILESVTNIMVEAIETYIRPIGRHLDFIFFGDDLGTQTAPIISPQVYRRYVKPKHEQIVDAFKSASRAKVIIHSDGAISPLIEDLADTGIAGINPVQVAARGMDSKQLKEKFGNRIIFWGAIDTQRVLPFGTTSDVRKEVRLRIDDMGEGGGYVLTSVHNIQPLTPPENIVAMYDEAIRYGCNFYGRS
ncbi:MAG: uroporphyrinogen decarboxylase family protein [Nitrososphaeria archaeon]